MDLAIKVLENGAFDLNFDADLITTDSLFGSVALSLETNARENALGAESANLSPTLGGWWADALDENGTLGGHLFEAFPGKVTEGSLATARTLALQSLEWLKEDGVASSVNCNAFFDGENLSLEIEISKPDGTAESFAFELNWRATNGV